MKLLRLIDKIFIRTIYLYFILVALELMLECYSSDKWFKKNQIYIENLRREFHEHGY